MVFLVHVVQEVNNTVAVSIFIVIPAHRIPHMMVSLGGKTLVMINKVTQEN